MPLPQCSPALLTSPTSTCKTFEPHVKPLAQTAEPGPHTPTQQPRDVPRMLDRHFCLRSPPAGGQKIARKIRPRCKDMRYRIRSPHARYKPLKQIQEAGGPRGHWDAELSGFTVNSKCLNLQHPKKSEKLRKPLSAESEHPKDMKDPDNHIRPCPDNPNKHSNRVPAALWA